MEQTKTLANSGSRLDYLDSVRGLCVLFIVIEHHLLGADFIRNCLYSFSLTVFFLISGFLYAHKLEWEQPLGSFLKKNLMRIVYPYCTLSIVNLIWNVLYYKVVFPTAVPDFYSLSEMLLYSVTTYGYNALWYLPCMFWGALLFALVRKQKHHRLIWAVCAVFIILFYILFNDALSGHGLLSYVYSYLFRCYMAMIFLYAGHLLYDVLRKLKGQRELIVLIGSLMVSGVLMALYQLCPEQFPIVNLAAHRLGNPYVYYLAALAPALAIFILCRRYRMGSGLLAYFGRNSLIVMALHMDIFVRIAWYVVAKLGIALGETGNSILVILMELAMAPVFIYFINRFFPFLIKPPRKAKN